MKPLFLFILLLTFAHSQKLSLEDCIQIGLNNKSTLKSALSGKSAAEQSVNTSFSNLLPSVGFSGNLNRTYFPERETVAMNFENFQTDTFSLSHSQNIRRRTNHQPGTTGKIILSNCAFQLSIFPVRDYPGCHPWLFRIPEGKGVEGSYRSKPLSIEKAIGTGKN